MVVGWGKELGGGEVTHPGKVAPAQRKISILKKKMCLFTAPLPNCSSTRWNRPCTSARQPNRADPVGRGYRGAGGGGVVRAGELALPHIPRVVRVREICPPPAPGHLQQAGEPASGT